MELAPYKHPSGLFQALVPTSWQIASTGTGSTQFVNPCEPNGAIKVSLFRLDVPRRGPWTEKRLSDSSASVEENAMDERTTGRTWVLGTGSTMAMVSYFFQTARSADEKEEASAVLDSLTFFAPSEGTPAPKRGRFARLFGR